MAIACFAISGAGMAMALTSFSKLMQERIPDDLRGRVMALWSVAFLGSRPLAAAMNGAIADAASPTVALLTVATLVGFAAVLCRPRRLDAYALPDPARIAGFLAASAGHSQTRHGWSPRTDQPRPHS